MTAGHKHRHIRIKRGSLVYRVLRKPILHSRNLPWVDRSRLVFGPCPYTDAKSPTCWTLSLLGLLHGLTGLTLWVPDAPKEE